MNTEDIISIRDSYIRCISQNDFPAAFYDKFINSSPTIQDKFKDVFNIKKRVMVTRGLNSIIKLAENSEPEESLKELARKHDRNNLDISPSLYPGYKQYMLKTLEEFDPEFNHELKKLWTEVIDTGIEFFIQHY